MADPDDGIFVHDTASVEPDATVGAGTKIWSNVQVRTGAGQRPHIRQGPHPIGYVEQVRGDKLTVPEKNTP